jgi:hypothetical protein
LLARGSAFQIEIDKAAQKNDVASGTKPCSSIRRTNVVKTFIQRFGDSILGVLHGFDRIRFRDMAINIEYRLIDEVA